MESKKFRLDRFVSSRTGVKKGDVRLLLAQKRVMVDGGFAAAINQVVDQFSHIVVDGQILQQNSAVYWMMHKPVGVVSATKDEIHKTVIDLLEEDNPEARLDDLHIVGRLDLNSSGLLLLTNDGEWSRRLTSPDKNVAKVYEVTLADPITDEYSEAFAQGMYFAFEDLTTLPAVLEKVSEYVARVTLMEGRYHQIKRMFGRFRNQVVELHRVSIGNLELDEDLLPGDSRLLTPSEAKSIISQ